MKNLLLFLVLQFALTVTSSGQVTDLVVNGSHSNFTMASGDLFSWSFTVPHPGDTTLVEFWIDTDQNGILNPAVDVIWTCVTQIDGDPNGQNGVPDMDGLPNQFVSMQTKLGLAPAHYIMVFKNHNDYKTIAGTITKLGAFTYTVSGNVTVPAGFSKQNIVLAVQQNGQSQETPFWNALTDANGDFSIKMNTNMLGEQWSLRTNNDIIFGSAVVLPQEYSIVFSSGTPAYSGYNFTVTASSASIRGIVKDENGNPFVSWNVGIYGSDGIINRFVQTDTSGSFKIGLLSSELPVSKSAITSASNNSNDTNFVRAFYDIGIINSGEVINHDLIVYRSNSTISGRVTLNGNPPNFTMQIRAMAYDSGFVDTFTDMMGYFKFHVSDKIHNYEIGAINPIGPEYGNTSIIAHPGQINVNLNFPLTDIKPGDSNIPADFNLAQNYPNPFNPVTTINYSVAQEGLVKLNVYNSIGSNVATLVNENKPAGHYSIQFNGSSLASGIYLYRLESGNFSADKKLILLK
jgi:hypothetical protein